MGWKLMLSTQAKWICIWIENKAEFKYKKHSHEEENGEKKKKSHARNKRENVINECGRAVVIQSQLNL